MTWILLVLLIFLGGAYFAFRSSAVQTWVTQKLTDRLAAQLDTRIEIAGVDIRPFKTVVLEGLYIEDQHQDTLLYARQLRIDVNDFDRAFTNISLGELTLDNARLNLFFYVEEDEMSHQFILDAFASESVDTTAVAPRIELEHLQLRNVNFSYRDLRDTITRRGMNYWDLHTPNVFAEITDVLIEEDTIRAKIESLSATEQCGFHLEKMSAYVNVNPTRSKLDELKIKTPNTSLKTDLIFYHQEYNDYNDFINKVKMDVLVRESMVSFADIAYFAPELKGMRDKVAFTGHVKGKVKRLRGRELDIYFARATNFRGNADLDGLPDIEETLLFVDVDRFTTNKKDLEYIPVLPFTSGKRLEVPENISLLGDIDFRGNFSGYLSNFVAYGKMNTELGRIDADLQMEEDSAKLFHYAGNMATYSFDIGRFLSLEDYLGTVSINTKVTGSGLARTDVDAILEGMVNQIEFNGYDYHGVEVEGELAQNIFEGRLKVVDPNLKLDFDGAVDYTGEQPAFDFDASLDHANLPALKFLPQGKKAILSSQIKASFTGDKIDDLLGSVIIDSTSYVTDEKQYAFKKFELNANKNYQVKEMKVRSSFADASIHGDFTISELEQSIRYFMHEFAPSYFTMEGIDEATLAKQNFKSTIRIKDAKAITDLLLPDIELASNTLISVNYNPKSNNVLINGRSPYIAYKNFKMNSWELSVDNKHGYLNVSSACDRFYIRDSIWAGQFNLVSLAHDDQIETEATWMNDDAGNNSGEIKSFLNFSEHPEMTIDFNGSSVVLNGQTWDIQNKAPLKIDTTWLAISELQIRSGQQSITLDGELSEFKQDKLFIEFRDFDLTVLNPYLESDGLSLKGLISGSTTLNDVYNDLLINSDLNFADFYVNGDFIGNGKLNSGWDKKKESVFLNGSFTKGNIPNVVFDGEYFPFKEKNSLAMQIKLEAIRLQVFEPFVKDFCSNLKGVFSASINVGGTLEEPLMDGSIQARGKKVTIDYLNADYNFQHNDIRIRNNVIEVVGLELYDQYRNKAILNGGVYHTNFKDWQLNIDLQTDKFLCLNTTEQVNELYYGKAFVTGIGKIYGPFDDITIEASVKTDKILTRSGTMYSDLHIPLSGTEEVSESNFITFVKHEEDEIKEEYDVALEGIRLNLHIDVTPDANVQLIFDPKVGDVIQGSGKGNITLEIDQYGAFTMYGAFEIEKGDYLFTLKNVLNKKFDVDKGGVIKWSGDPYNADINMTALYKVRASLHPLFPADSSGVYNRRYPVNCKLLMTENLMTPNIAFDILLPTVDDNTRQQVTSLINTDQEMNKQIFSLLVLNSFVTPPLYRDLGMQESSGAGVGATSSTELLSNQLSNMLSKISKDFDIGVNYRPGDDITSEELEVALSTQLFNDRVSIDGNVGVSGKDQTTTTNTSNIVGDVNVEYKLTNDGKTRLKAFNRANDNIIDNATAPYTQGVGVFYREDFDTIGELYRRYLGKVSKKNKSS